MDETKKAKIIESIEKTGFPLEYDVTKILRKNGWQVINNRYYIDDAKGIEREIDILAYKTMIDLNRVIYYTVLIVSCKKSTEHLWAFLTHKKPKIDPNTKYFTLNNKTNDKRLEYMLATNNGKIEDETLKKDSIKDMFTFDNRVFAFQQINKKSMKAEDDKRIYESIITCIKASEYEKQRNKFKQIEGVDTAFYNFNLISLFDGEIIEIHFDDSKKTISEIDEIHYLNRHIINKEEQYYKVHFVTKKIFDDTIKKYNALHDFNATIYPELVNEFYNSIFKTDKARLLWKEFIVKIKPQVSNILLRSNLDISLAEKLTFEFPYDELIIGFDFETSADDETYKIFQDNEIFMEKVEELLSKVFHYKGKFRFDYPLPF